MSQDIRDKVIIRKLTRDTDNHFLLVFALVNLLLSPIPIAFFPDYMSLIFVINFSLVIIAGFNVGLENKTFSKISFTLGVFALIGYWLEFAIDYELSVTVFRILFSFLFYLFITYRIFHWFISHDEISLSTIFASIAGFLLLGCLGGICCEVLDRSIPGSFTVEEGSSSYYYLYFSFITLTSVGYGDILPANEQGQALALLIGIAGQFYLTIIVAILVGKYLSTRQ